jgi:endoglucanase
MLDKQSRYRQDLLTTLSGMADYMTNHSMPPAVVASDGHIKDASGSVGFSAALLPFLKACDMKAAISQQERRLQAERNVSDGLFGKAPRYYDQNLALFGTGWCEGRFRFESNGMLKVSWNR